MAEITSDAPSGSKNTSQPIYFISHGSPTLFDEPDNPAFKYLSKLPAKLPQAPKALVVVSAHWEEPHVSVTSSVKLIYDFYGFPAHMYKATWAVKEDADLAKHVLDLIQKTIPDAVYDPKRGIDHGVWSPLKIAFPDGGIPVVQVSLQKKLDLDFHLKLGEALRPLADENVLVICSGGSTHNLRLSFSGGAGGNGQQSWAPNFEKFVADSATLPVEERNTAYVEAKNRPDFRLAHPREEHYVPLLVAAGAGGGKSKVEHFTWLTPNFGMTQIRFEPHASL